MSEATNHTPGPWHVGGLDGRDKIVYGPDDLPVCNAITFHGRTSPGEMLANASLIAAAPELLQVARQVEYELANRGPDVWFPPHVRIALKAAIAKAEGR